MTDEGRAEKINELMNRISFALKDATLAQGFEIICKRISELEKDNEELNEIRNQQARIINNDTDRIEKLEKKIVELNESIEDWKADHEYNFELMKGLNERIAELKKENEELRKNQIVWHNPDELPPLYENTSFSINVLAENGVYVEYDFDAHHWNICGTNRKIIIKKWTDSFPSCCK